MHFRIYRASIISLAILSLLLALLLIAEPGRLLKLDTDLALNGFQTRFSLDARYLAELPSDRPYLLTAVFAECPDVCPMNMHTLASLADRFKDDLSFVLISLDVAADRAALQAWAESVLPGAVVIHSDTDTQLRQLMSQLPEPFYPSKTTIHHSGAIYLTYPDVTGFIKYRPQDREFIHEDLVTLQRNRHSHANS